MIKNKNNYLYLILLVVPLGGIGIDLYSASMPALGEFLHVKPEAIKSTLSIFLIGLFIGMLFCGILSDSYGRKYFQIGNSCVFMISSAFIPFLSDFKLIMFFRLIQGISAGGLQSVARSMITDVFTKDEITKNSLYVTSAWGIGPIIAPWLGGILAHYFSWKSCFYFFTIYGFFAVVCHSILMNETNTNRKQLNLQNLKINVFHIIKNNNFIIPVLAMSLAYSSLIIYGISGPYFVEISLHLTPLKYGNIGFVIGCGYLTGTIFCRILVGKKWSAEQLLKKSIIFVLAINTIDFLAYFLGINSNIIWIFNSLLTCFGMGFIYPIYMTKSIQAFADVSGIASGLTISSVLLLTSIISLILNMLTITNAMEFVLIYVILVICIFIIWFFSHKK